MTDNAAPTSAPRGGVSQLRAAVSAATAAPAPAAAPSAPAAVPAPAAAPAHRAPLSPMPGAQMPPVAPAANDNAEPTTPPAGLPDEIAALEAEIAAKNADPNAPAADAEQIAGMPLGDLTTALKGCQVMDDGNGGQGIVLTPELAARFLVQTRMDGQDVTVPFAEAARGAIRQNTLTRKTQEIAQQAQQVEERAARMRQLFDGWDEPTGAGLVQGLEKMGKAGLVRQQLHAAWGTPDQPNVDGFMQYMQKSGHWGTFLAAADARAADFAARIEDFAPGYQQLPPDQRKAARARAIQMIRSLDAQHIQQLSREAQLEAKDEQIRAREAKSARDAALAAQQRQPQQDPAAMQQLAGVRQRAFEHFGLMSKDAQGRSVANPVAEHYFGQYLQAEIEIATRNRMQIAPDELIARAAEATRDQLADDRRTSGLSLGKQPAAPAAPALPARPIASPTAGVSSGVPALPAGRGLTEFRARVKMLQNAGRKR